MAAAFQSKSYLADLLTRIEAGPNTKSRGRIQTAMTVWTERYFPGGFWSTEVEAGFLRLRESLGSPVNMMLVSVVNDHRIPRLIASLPSKEALNALNGFQLMSKEQLPKKASLLAGDQREFETVFEYDVIGQ